MARKVRKRRRPRSRGRTSQRRLGRGLLIAGLALALLYFAFTRVFFSPFEEGQKPFHLLAPRDVDLYLRREALASDFTADGALPVPRLYDRIRITSTWKEFTESALWQELEWPRDLTAAVGELEPQLRELPLDPVGDVLGREVVVVARGLERDDAHWAFLGRLSDKAKFAVELFGFDSVFEEALPGATREELHDETLPEATYHRVVLPAGGAAEGDPADAGAAEGDAYYYARRTDLLVVSDDETLLRDVLKRTSGDSEDTVGLSRTYGEHMPAPSRGAHEMFSLGFTMTAGALLDAWGLAPDRGTPSADATENILRGLVDVELLGDVVGRLELDGSQASLRMHGEIDVGRAASDEGGLLGQTPFTVHERLRDVLGLVPADVSAVATLNVSLNRFLTTVTRGFSPDVVKLLNDTLREVASLTAGWQVDTLPELTAELARALGNEITIVVRPLDHVIPEGSQPLPAMAFVLPVDDLAAWTAVEDSFLRAHDLFGIPSDRMKQLDEGVGDRKWLGLVNQPIEEIAYIVLDGSTLVIATDNDLLREIVEVYADQRMSLAGTPEVARLVDGFRRPGADVAQANAAVWASSGGVWSVLEPYGEYIADLETIIDLGAERIRQRKALINKEYRQFAGADELPAGVEEEVDRKLDQILAAQEAKRRSETIPQLAAAWRDGYAWLPLVKQAAVALRLGERSTNLEVRLDTFLGK